MGPMSKFVISENRSNADTSTNQFEISNKNELINIIVLPEDVTYEHVLTFIEKLWAFGVNSELFKISFSILFKDDTLNVPQLNLFLTWLKRPKSITSFLFKTPPQGYKDMPSTTDIWHEISVTYECTMVGKIGPQTTHSHHLRIPSRLYVRVPIRRNPNTFKVTATAEITIADTAAEFITPAVIDTTNSK